MHPEKPSANSETEGRLQRFGPWPLWRRLMLLGALILLANALADAFTGVPRSIDVVATATGFVLLVVGFGLRMRSR